MRLIDVDALIADIHITIDNSGCVNHEKEIMDCVIYADIIMELPDDELARIKEEWGR